MNPTNEFLLVIILGAATLLLAIVCVVLLVRRGGLRSDDARLHEAELGRVRLETEAETLRAEAAALRGTVAQRESEIETRRREADDARAEKAVAEERAQALARDKAALEEQLGSLAAENRRGRDALAEHGAARRLLEENVARLNLQSDEASRQLSSLLEENRNLGRENSELRARLTAADEKLATLKGEIEAIREKSHLEFESVANRLLDAKSEKFTLANRDNIEQILLPLKADIAKFKDRVDQVYDAESKERALLGEKVRELVEKTDQVSAEANNLATALKGQAKSQGNWGEIILERVLEANGLERGREYDVQFPLKSDDGGQQFLDVVLHLPDNRKLIIDSKVTLNAYERYCASDNDGDRAQFLREHLTALGNHIDQLSAKKYFEMEHAADFVMLFVPVEPAYLTAIQSDGELWSRAYRKKVILISPTNLMAAIKLIADLWARERQNRNTLKIAEQGGRLYDKFVNFLKDMEAIGVNIDRAQDAYRDAFAKLRDGRGNLISRAEKLKALGVTSSKTLPASMAAFEEDDDVEDATIG